ncbi:unnamed protein product [Spirodela intermedia]|uniref:Uncharacterized protein n=1 Tax=Spirodela intermedia TaxID=51605 RepID=A0A7I8KZT5_SPIIN|nr:unnamed protein product [Spirodela intermedia]
MLRQSDRRARRRSPPRRWWWRWCGRRPWRFLAVFAAVLLLASYLVCAAVLRRANALGRRCSAGWNPAWPRLRIAMVSFSDERGGGGRSFLGMMDAVRSNKMKYSAARGYDFHDAGDIVDRRRPPSWSKILAIQRHLPDYDWVFWNDADSLVTNFSITLDSVLWTVIGDAEFDDLPDLILTEDFNGFNAGMFFVRRSRWSDGFLQTWWNQTDFIRFGSTKSGDNDALKYLIRELPAEERRRHVRVSPMQCLFNSYPWVFTWKSFYRLLRSPGSFWRGAYSDGDFMVHLAGLDNKREWVTKILNGT